MKTLSPLTISSSEYYAVPKKTAAAQLLPAPGEDDVNLYVNTMNNIRNQVDQAETIDDAWMKNVLGSIRVLSGAFIKQTSNGTAAVTVGHLKGGISSDRDRFIETLMK